MTAPLLSTSGLTRHFSGVKAVEKVDFRLDDGEIRALIGPNGAGKSTLVGMIAGRIAPTAGTVRFRGEDISRLPAHKRIRLGIAYTFQITSVFSGLPVLENAMIAAQNRRRKTGTTAEQAAMDALDRVGLADRAEATAGDLSYGHQRLLELAMGIAQAPDLLILDEPTQGLSDGEIEVFQRLVRELNRSTTVLLIEHNMPVVMAVADRITVLDQGEILAEGTPGDIKADRRVQAAYLGGAADD